MLCQIKTRPACRRPGFSLMYRVARPDAPSLPADG
jgi:hypothetical protein